MNYGLDQFAPRNPSEQDVPEPTDDQFERAVEALRAAAPVHDLIEAWVFEGTRADDKAREIMEEDMADARYEAQANRAES